MDRSLQGEIDNRSKNMTDYQKSEREKQDARLEHILEVYEKVSKASIGNSDQFETLFNQVMRVLYPQ